MNLLFLLICYISISSFIHPFSSASPRSGRLHQASLSPPAPICPPFQRPLIKEANLISSSSSSVKSSDAIMSLSSLIHSWSYLILSAKCRGYIFINFKKTSQLTGKHPTCVGKHCPGNHRMHHHHDVRSVLPNTVVLQVLSYCHPHILNTFSHQATYPDFFVWIKLVFKTILFLQDQSQAPQSELSWIRPCRDDLQKMKSEGGKKYSDFEVECPTLKS